MRRFYADLGVHVIEGPPPERAPERLEALQLPVPVSVTVDLDTPWNDAPEQPRAKWAVGPIDTATAAAIAATPTPDSLPGAPLDRAES